MGQQRRQVAPGEELDRVVEPRWVLDRAADRELLHQDHEEARRHRRVVQCDHGEPRADAGVVDHVADHAVGAGGLDERGGRRRRAEHERRGAVEVRERGPQIVGRRVDRGLGTEADGERRAGSGSRSTATTRSCPRSTSVAIAASPIGPQPSTHAPSPGRTSAWSAACIPTASGSANAATSSGMRGGHRVQPVAVGVGDEEQRREPALRAAVADPAELVVPGVDHDAVADAGRARPGRRPSRRSRPSRARDTSAPAPGPATPPSRMYERSLPQIPHAATRTTTSSGPGSGSGTSSTRDVARTVDPHLQHRSQPSAGVGREQERHRVAHRRVDELDPHAEVVEAVVRERDRRVVAGAPAQLERASGCGERRGGVVEPVGPEAEVVQVRVLVAHPDGAGRLLDELEARVAGRVAERRRQHEVGAGAVAVLDRGPCA